MEKIKYFELLEQIHDLYIAKGYIKDKHLYRPKMDVEFYNTVEQEMVDKLVELYLEHPRQLKNPAEALDQFGTKKSMYMWSQVETFGQSRDLAMNVIYFDWWMREDLNHKLVNSVLRNYSNFARMGKDKIYKLMKLVMVKEFRNVYPIWTNRYGYGGNTFRSNNPKWMMIEKLNDVFNLYPDIKRNSKLNTLLDLED